MLTPASRVGNISNVGTTDLRDKHLSAYLQSSTSSMKRSASTGAFNAADFFAAPHAVAMEIASLRIAQSQA
jgi:hypothetical protein